MINFADVMRRRLQLTSDQWLSLAIIAVTTIGLGIIWCAGCPTMDDFWYKGRYLQTVVDGQSLSEGFLTELIYRATTDNVRLPNLIFIFLQPFEYRVWTGLFCAICWAVTYLSALRLSNSGLNRPWLTAVLSLLWLLWLPWEEFMLSAAFYLNYIFPTALAMLMLALFVSDRRCVVTGCILAFLTSWSHEMAGATIVAGMSGYLLFDRNGNVKCRLWMLSFAVVGMMIHLVAPAFAVHFREYAHGAGSIFPYDELLRLWNIWIFCLVGAIILIVKAVRRATFSKLSTPTIAMFGCVGLAGIAVHIVFPFSNMMRAAWTPIAIVSVGYIYLLERLEMPKIISRIIGAAVLAVLCWHFTATSIEVFKSRRYYLPALREYEQNGHKPLFTKILAEKEILEASLGRGSRLLFQPGYAAANLSNYMDNGNMRSLVFIPEELADVAVNPGEPVPGGTDLRLKDGYLYRPVTPEEERELTPFEYMTADVTRGNVTRRERFMLGEFTTADGSRWLYAASTARLRCTVPISRIEY